MRARSAIVLILVLAAMPASARSHAGPARLAAERSLRAQGVNPGPVLRSVITLWFPDSEGQPRAITKPLAHWLAIIDHNAPASVGPAGTPETLVGDIFHSYTNTKQGYALMYQVTQSTRLPSTPGATVPGPFGYPLFFVSSGGWFNIRSDYYYYGVHTAGTSKMGNGSNIDTARGPEPSPIVLPVVHDTDRRDAKIDFAGQRVYLTQDQTCTIDNICTSVGFFLGSGVAVFDSDSVSLPLLP